MTMITDNAIEQYIAEKNALIAEMTGGITAIFQKLEKNLLELIDHLEIRGGRGEYRYAAFLVAGGPDEEGEYDEIPEVVQVQMRAQFQHFKELVEMQNFRTSYHDSESEWGDKYGHFEISFTALALKLELVEEMGIDMKEPITIIWDLRNNSDIVEVRVPLMMHLELVDLERFVSIFRRTWANALTWARMQ